MLKCRRYQEIVRRILHEDNHLIVYNKPFGLPIQPNTSSSISTSISTTSSESHPSIPYFPPNSVYNDLKYYLQQKYSKPGNIYLGIVHRLDKLTSGIIIFAKTSKSASRLGDSFLHFDVKKKYLALAHGVIDIPVVYEDYIDDTSNPVQIISTTKYQQNPLRYKNYKFASCSISPLCQFSALNRSISLTFPPICTALSVELTTGRKHQIRSQLSSHGNPIIGDIKYHAPCASHPGFIGLHSYQVTFPHPITKDLMNFQSPIPSEWKGKVLTPQTYELITSLINSTCHANKFTDKITRE